MRGLCCFLSCALVVSASAQSAVLVVDRAHPSGTFATVADAVSAAADGDIILVRSGLYGAVVVDGKGLAIVNDAGSVGLDRLVIRNLPAQSVVTVRGIDLT